MLSAAEQDEPPETQTRLKRKIAAILAADVSGYSRLVAQDEEGTLRALAEARQIFDRLVRRGGGRIFNTAGDSVMCDFDSAVEAVRVALKIQEELQGFNAAVPADRRLEFRIGITIGDVVERGDDLLGDGVNIAARLEGISPPGGICISRSVHEAVANKIEAAFQDLGPQVLKNLPQPIHAFIVPPPQAPSVALAAVRLDEAEQATGQARRPKVSGAGAGWGLRAALIGMVLLAVPAIFGLGIVSEDWLFPSRPALAPPAQPVPRAQPEPVRNAGSVPRETAKPPAADRPVASPAPAAADRPAGRAAAFAALGSQGLLPEPKTVPELYHNARLLETKGDQQGALRLYAALAPLAGDVVDPLLRYATLLRNVSGPEVARATFERLPATGPTRSLTLARAMLAEGTDRIVRLKTLEASTQAFVPVDYLLALALTERRQGGPTITDRRVAFAALDNFLEAAEAGSLAPLFVDRAFLDGWVVAARARRAEIEAFFATAQTRPVAAFARAEGGWNARVTLPEPATSVTARIGDSGTPSPARVAGGGSQTNAEFFVPGTTERTTIYLTYRDLTRNEAGPFPVPFDPAAAAVSAGRDALERFPETWVSFRQDLPDLLSYAQLVANRCAIKQALIGFGDEPPSQPLALPACEPGASAETRAIVTLPDGTDAVQVQLTYADGGESAVRMFRRP